jgi:AraC-like DNA-binding protein
MLLVLRVNSGHRILVQNKLIQVILIRTITDIIAIITVAQLILFALFLLGTKKERGSDKIMLAFFLIANGFYILDFLAFRYNKEIIPYTVNLFFIGGTFGFLFGPLLYLYTKAITSKEFKFTKKEFLHFIPFFIIFSLTFIHFQIQSYEIKLNLLKTGIYNITETTIYLLLMNGITIIYLIKAFLLTKQKNKKLKAYFSSLDKINFEWLKLVVTAFFIMWVVDIINLVAGSLQINTSTSEELLTFTSLLINFIFANLLILKNLHIPQLEEDSENEGNKHKYEKSPLTYQNKIEILHRLEVLMADEKLYLNSSLNLGEIAQRLSIAPRYFSQVINELKGQNFYDFVNSYRIDEAKRLLSDPDHKKDKILTVLYECGFNSKSVFNTLFKKSTGITPSDYRKKYKFSA